MRCKPWKGLGYLRRLICVFVVIALSLVIPSTVGADQDSFETSEPTWKLGQTDTRLIKIQHQRVFDESHSGNGAEYLKVAHGQGTYAYLQYRVTPARLMNELNPRIWIKSNHPHLQLLARVVLPRTSDPHTGKPVTALLPGTTYDDVNNWQQLSIPMIKSLLQQRVPALRSQFGSDLDARQAYVDMVVLNTYSAPGTTNLWIDDFEMSRNTVSVGPESAQPATYIDTPGITQQIHANPISIRGSIILVDGQPFFPRVVKHNGESIPFLAGLGFNVIALDRLPTADESVAASQFGLWFTVPYVRPSNSVSPQILGRVISWDYGDSVGTDGLAEAAFNTREIRGLTEGLQRPTIVNATENHRQFSNHVDICRIDWHHLYSSLSVSSATHQITSQIASLKRGSPFWVNIHTQPPPDVISQWNAMAPGIRFPRSTSYSHIRDQALRSVALGARGVYFKSWSRLDLPDVHSQLRQHALFLANRELQLLEPWIAGGMSNGQLKTDDSSIESRMIQTQRARLVFVFDKQRFGQLLKSPVDHRPVNLSIPGVPITYKAYDLTPTSVTRLRNERQGSANVPLELDNSIKTVILTADPLVRDYLQRLVTQNRQRVSTAQYQLQQLKLESTVEVLRQLGEVEQFETHRDKTLLAGEYLEKLRHHLLREEWDSAKGVIGQVNHLLDDVRQKTWMAHAEQFPSPVAHPHLLSFETLPAYRVTMSQTANGVWSANRLSGGDFESIKTLVDTGWQHFRHTAHTVTSTVSQSSEYARQGQYCLQILTTNSMKPSYGSLFMESPVWIATPRVRVSAGQLVRVKGWINIPDKLESNGDGLLVYDSIGGPALAERFYQTSGWQPFTLLRTAQADSDVTVTFVMMGLGVAKIDNVSIQVLESDKNPTPRSSNATSRNPLIPTKSTLFAPN